MAKQILVQCDCNHFYITAKVKSQCSQCGNRNTNEASDLPEWIKWDKNEGKYILLNS